MRVNPITEQEAVEAAKPKFLLKPGACDFEVIEATDEKSKANNEMIHLVMQCWDQDGKKALVHDYLLDAIAHKLRHAAYAVGLGHAYESGELVAEQFVGKGGSLLIKTKEQQGYSPKNEVADYVIAEQTKKTPGYSRARTRDAAEAKPRESTARAAAWKSFSVKTTDIDGTGRNALWFEALAQFFGHNDQNKLTDAEWSRFEVAVRGQWDKSVGGFPMAIRKKEPVTSPIADDAPPEFKEDDIPF